MSVQICSKLARLISQFLWGLMDRRAIHWVSWETLCLPKSCGGLGLIDFKRKNKALLLKWIWRYGAESNSLWRKVIQAKYEPASTSLLPTKLKSSNYSWLWRNITAQLSVSESLFMQNIQFIVGDGRRIQFWTDHWIGPCNLSTSFPRIYALATRKQGVIADFGIPVSGVWNWNILLRRNLFGWERELHFCPEVFKPVVLSCGSACVGLNWSIERVQRENNTLADNLAKKGISRTKELCIFLTS
ncbi:hypothetical protein V6N13_000818 [Hibiscus sabdariffa]